ncbi:OLC1v1031374C1 [Oldenlandia corymbosa var. corymbosa]|uniref:OLC1v1031374C1 n=1 Tax=Oldenlandia corymbosa var. corymbosa TaxID=529605 RepID=A0AAV1CJA0_OLDCO|nr:OLC1v1031374C1 [Oldenlandia corymbosa var. corymbosa]
MAATRDYFVVLAKKRAIRESEVPSVVPNYPDTMSPVNEKIQFYRLGPGFDTTPLVLFRHVPICHPPSPHHQFVNPDPVKEKAFRKDQTQFPKNPLAATRQSTRLSSRSQSTRQTAIVHHRGKGPVDEDILFLDEEEHKEEEAQGKQIGEDEEEEVPLIRKCRLSQSPPADTQKKQKSDAGIVALQLPPILSTPTPSASTIRLGLQAPTCYRQLHSEPGWPLYDQAGAKLMDTHSAWGKVVAALKQLMIDAGAGSIPEHSGESKGE